MTEFLKYVALNLARGVVPTHLEIKDTTSILHMFQNLRMKKEYRDFFIKEFNQYKQSCYFLRPLAQNEARFLKTRVRGSAEYFYYVDLRHKKMKIFFIGPYVKPIQTVFEKDYKKQ